MRETGLAAQAADRQKPPIFLRELLERAIGIEPMTSSLGSWHSAAELRPLVTDCAIAAELIQASPHDCLIVDLRRFGQPARDGVNRIYDTQFQCSAAAVPGFNKFPQKGRAGRQVQH